MKGWFPDAYVSIRRRRCHGPAAARQVSVVPLELSDKWQRALPVPDLIAVDFAPSIKFQLDELPNTICVHCPKLTCCKGLNIRRQNVS